MSKKKIVSIILSFCLVGAVISACGSKQGSSGNSTLKIGTNSVGSVYYTLAVGISELLLKHAEINSSVEAVGGSDANMFAMADNEIDLAVADSPSAYNAMNTIAPFKEKVDVSLVAVGQTSFRPIVVRKNSGIKSVEDLVGKKLIGIRPALFEFELITNNLLQTYGIDNSKVNIIKTVETNETVEALRTGTVDAAIFPVSLGNALLSELLRDNVVEFLPMEEAKVDQVISQLPKSLYKSVIPKGSFPNQDQDVTTFALATYFVADSSVPEDKIYEITKTFFDNNKEFVSFHNAAKEWTLERTTKSKPIIPFHPGTIKYLKETGNWSSELQSAQDALTTK